MTEVYVCEECNTRHLSFEDFMMHCRMYHADEAYVPYRLEMRKEEDE